MIDELFDDDYVLGFALSLGAGTQYSEGLWVLASVDTHTDYKESLIHTSNDVPQGLQAFLFMTRLGLALGVYQVETMLSLDVYFLVLLVGETYW